MTAEEIVRALAVARTERFRFSDGCMLCDEVEPGRGDDIENPADHAATCPWRQARAWVAEHPA